MDRRNGRHKFGPQRRRLTINSNPKKGNNSDVFCLSINPTKNQDEVSQIDPGAPKTKKAGKTKSVPSRKNIKKLPKEDTFFEKGQKEISQIIGYLTLVETQNTPKSGPYLPNSEKKRQLEDVTEWKKTQKLAKWGNENIGVKDASSAKHQLRAGRVVLNSVCAVPAITDRGRERALEASKPIFIQPATNSDVDNPSKKLLQEAINIDLDDDKEGKVSIAKLKKRLEVQKKAEKDKLSANADRIRKRKEALERAAKEKYEKRRARIDAAVSESLGPQLEKAQSSLGGEVSRHGNSIKKSSLNADGFVFNINEKNDVEKVKKIRPSVASLKEELKKQLEIKKQLNQLEVEGKFEEMKQMKEERAWQAAEQHAEKIEVNDLSTVTSRLKRAERQQKNSGKKLGVVMARQKREKHRTFLKRKSNLRERRVGRLAKKMTTFSKKGHYVPGFM